MTQYALEWSQRQNCFHIQPLEHSLAYAQECFIYGRAPLYSILMVGEKEAIHAMADSWRDRIFERDRVRAQPQMLATS